MNKLFKALGMALLALTFTLASCEKDPQPNGNDNGTETPDNGGDNGSDNGGNNNGDNNEPTTTIAQGAFVEEGTYPGWPIPTSGLDFDKDGTIEFRVYDSPTGLDYGYIIFNYEDGGNNLTTNWDEVSPVAEGSTIDGSCSFGSYGDATLDASPATQYIGFRIKFDDGIHYGWTKVTISGTHVDWCEVYYEKTPNKAIKAGQKQ